MRWLCLALIAACSASSPAPDAPPAGCPGGVSFDSTCTPAQETMRCFVENTFSSCDSGWYRCSGGRWVLDASLGVDEGRPCTGMPISSCYFEGTADCAVNPTAEACSCGTDGLWHCSCACYGAQTTCPVDCPPQLPDAATNPGCTDVGKACTYPGHTCTCGSDGHFACT